MKYIFTDLYEEFSCIGGECSDSCCIGWEIVVDKDTYNRYSSLPEPQRTHICQYIEEQVGENGPVYKIRMNEKERCPFLNNQNLCKLYIELSPDAMCNICKTYPRKIVAYYDAMLLTVSVSCPEVARILIQKKGPITFGFSESGSQEEAIDADWTLYNELINGLVLTTNILQSREYPIWQRIYLVLLMTKTIQDYIDTGKLIALREKIECYREPNFCREVVKILNQNTCDRNWSLIYSLFERIDEFDGIAVETKDFLQKFRLIGKQEEIKYQVWCERFRELDIETEYENLAVELIFEYYLDALKGKNLYISMAKMLIVLILVRSLEIVEYNIRKELTEQARISIISKTSRVIEHSEILDIIAAELAKRDNRDMLYQLVRHLY